MGQQGTQITPSYSKLQVPDLVWKAGAFFSKYRKESKRDAGGEVRCRDTKAWSDLSEEAIFEQRL